MDKWTGGYCKESGPTNYCIYVIHCYGLGQILYAECWTKSCLTIRLLETENKIFNSSPNRKWNSGHVSVFPFIFVICSLTIEEEGRNSFPL